MADTKTYQAKHRYARTTARKARLIADLIRGRGVNDALEVLQFQHKRAASYYSKLLRSAMANASQTEGVNVNALVITDCRADDGPMLQGRTRFRPGPQGRAMPFRKVTSHLSIGLAAHGAESSTRRGAKKSRVSATSKRAGATTTRAGATKGKE